MVTDRTEPTAYVKISPCQGEHLYFPFDRIRVNSMLFRAVEARDNEQARHYLPADESTSDTLERISFVEGLDSENYPSGFVSKRILVNGIPFLRRCESYYTRLEDLTEKDIISVFDDLAPRYNDLIEKDLNERVVERVFRYIQRRHLCPRQPEAKKNSRNHQIAMTLPEKHWRSDTEENQSATSIMKVLDYGVGTGLSYAVYKRRHEETKVRIALSGCDVSPRMLEICRHLHPEFDVRQCSYASTPYENAEFDVVMAIFVTHYFWDIRPYKEIFRILKPEGLLVFNAHNGSLHSPTEQESVLARARFQSIRHRVWHVKSGEREREIHMYFARKGRVY